MALYLRGTDGNIVHSGGYVSGIRTWTLDLVVEALEVSRMGTDFRKFVSGIKGWSGSYTAAWEVDSITDGDVNTTGQAPAAITFKFADTGGTEGTIAGNVLITGVHYSVDIAAANSLTFDFVGDDSITVVEHIT